jgi:hypothetical protein
MRDASSTGWALEQGQHVARRADSAFRSAETEAKLKAQAFKGQDPTAHYKNVYLKKYHYARRSRSVGGRVPMSRRKIRRHKSFTIWTGP